MLTESQPHSNEGKTFGDPGVLRRAVALARESLGVSEVSNDSDIIPRSMGELADHVMETDELVARVMTLHSSRMLDLSDSSAILCHFDDGWLVVADKRITLLQGSQETSISTRGSALSDLFGAAPRPCVYLERRYALSSVSAIDGDETPWARLRGLLSLEAPQFIALFVYALVLGGATLAVPVAAQVLVNTIAFGSLLQPLVVLALILFSVLSFAGLTQLMQWYALEVLKRRIFVRVAEDFSRRLPWLSADSRKSNQPRELANRFFEIITIQKSVGILVLDGLGLVLQTVAGLTLLAFYHPLLLALAVFLTLALLGVGILGRGAVESAVTESKAKYKVAAWLEHIADRDALYRTPQGSIFAAQKTDRLIRAYLTTRKIHYRKVLKQLCGGVGLQVASMTILLGVGGLLVIKNELTLGQLVAAEIIVGIIATGFTKVGKLAEVAYDLLAGLDKVGNVIDTEMSPLAPSAQNYEDLAVGIAWQDFASSSTSTQRPVSLTVPFKSSVWMTSRRREYATHFLRASADLENTSGRLVFVNREGLQLVDATPRALFFRGIDIVEGSFFENLRVANTQLAREQATEALREAGLTACIATFSKGIDAQVGPEGALLSNVEKARLALARALVSDADILLLDGIFSDGAFSEIECSDALRRLIRPERVVVVADKPDLRPESCGNSFELESTI